MTNTLATESTVNSTPTKAEVSVSTNNFLLTTHDRCDSCGAQAYFQVNFDNGQLMFCSHHYRKSEAKLLTQAVSIRDESAQLN
jgi:hypothetical protein